MPPVPDLRPPAIPEGWPHHLQEADHLRGFSCPGLPTLWRGYTPMEQRPAPPTPWKSSAAQKHQSELFPAMGSRSPLQGSPASSGCPGEALPCFSAAWLAAPTLGRHCTPAEQLPRIAHPRRAPQPRNARASSSWPWEVCLDCSADLPVLPAWGKSSFASERPCQPRPSSENALLPQRRPANTTSP